MSHEHERRPHRPYLRTPMLGLGWAFPVCIGAQGIAIAADEEAVRRAIVIVLRTMRGERAMRPDFGSNLHRLLFMPNNRATRAAAEFEVRDALLHHEPRIEVLDVQTSTSPEFPSAIWIDVNYRVRSTDNRFNLVYPFYLDRAEA